MPKQTVVGGHLPLALIDLDRHGHLVVVGRAEDLLPLGGNGRVLVDQLGHDAAEGLDSQRQGRHVQQEHVLDVAGQHAALDRGPHGHDLVRVDALVRLLAVEHILDDLLHLGHAGRSADQHHLVDVPRAEMGVFHRLLHRSPAVLDQVVDQLFELGTGNGHLQVLRAAGVGGDERQVQSVDWAELSSFFAFSHASWSRCNAIVSLRRSMPYCFLELVGDVVDQALVEVVAAQVGVAVGADDAEHAVGHFQHRDVERAAAEVEHDDLFVLLLVEAIGQRGGGRLVDDPGDFQAGDLAGVLGGLALGVVEIGRHGNHGLVDFVAQVGLGRLLQLPQGEGRDFRRRVLVAVDVDLDVVLGAADDLVGHHLLFGGHLVVAAAHEALDRVDGARRVGDGLASGRLADDGFPFIGERDDAGRETIPLGVGDDLHVFAFHHGDDRVGRSEVDSDDLFSARHAMLLYRTSEDNGIPCKNNSGEQSPCRGRGLSFRVNVKCNPLNSWVKWHVASGCEKFARGRPPVCHFGMVGPWIDTSLWLGYKP